MYDPMEYLRRLMMDAQTAQKAAALSRGNATGAPIATGSFGDRFRQGVLGQGTYAQSQPMMQAIEAYMGRDRSRAGGGMADLSRGFRQGRTAMDQIRQSEMDKNSKIAFDNAAAAQQAFENQQSVLQARNREDLTENNRIRAEAALQRANNPTQYNGAARFKIEDDLLKRYGEVHEISFQADDVLSRMEEYNQKHGRGQTGGQVEKLEDFFRNNTGARDQYSYAKRDAVALRNRILVEGLPPGIASDTDVAIILKGLPEDNASFEEWKLWLEAVKRIERRKERLIDIRLEHLDDPRAARDAMKAFYQEVNGGRGWSKGELEARAAELGIEVSEPSGDEGAETPTIRIISREPIQ